MERNELRRLRENQLVLQIFLRKQSKNHFFHPLTLKFQRRMLKLVSLMGDDDEEM